MTCVPIWGNWATGKGSYFRRSATTTFCTPKRRDLASRNKSLCSEEKDRECWNSDHKTAKIAVCAELPVSRGNFSTSAAICLNQQQPCLYCFVWGSDKSQNRTLSSPVGGKEDVIYGCCILYFYIFPGTELGREGVGPSAACWEWGLALRAVCQNPGWVCVETWTWFSPLCLGCFPSFHSGLSQLLLNLHHLPPSSLPRGLLLQKTRPWVRKRNAHIPHPPTPGLIQRYKTESAQKEQQRTYLQSFKCEEDQVWF